MIVFNIVARVADDKNFFDSVLICVSKIKNNIGPIKLNIIGEIQSETIFNKLIAMALELNILENVLFTNKSIRYEDLDETYLSGYFLNFSVGNFVGYSPIEAISLGLKTIIINVDSDIYESGVTDISYCNNMEELYEFAVNVFQNEREVSKKVIEENLIRKNCFYLNEQESKTLLNYFKGI
ncbi:hypothetical protein AAE02nite_08880 [Adhaeribacter aerolatus]|uniref:Glycosyl transferase family 1 domain-containing protein n=1 Tax=Adhaeribacter aerolatus TaxID=670289 RepID=A0A512AU44_9BACT|nr:glycosyltransferase family 4 protein [Adhaeribacter aerolatus]GEO03224.1 hypothetical protein AAE02nite_08880 [Adhaeribacter aerolatus]